LPRTRWAVVDYAGQDRLICDNGRFCRIARHVSQAPLALRRHSRTRELI
jgi:hypothetical protein